jgi:hypothetical protein
MQKQRIHIAVLAGLVVVVLAFFYQVLFLGKLPVPTDTLVGLYHPWRDSFAQTNPRGVPFKNFLITDPVRQQIPWRKVVIDAWKQGHIPLWNPYAFGGASIVANIQAAVWYPINSIFLVLPFMDAWTVLIVLQPLLAAWFMYMYLRSRQLSNIASQLGALVWAFCGFSVAWMSWGTIMHTALWIPLLLLSVDTLISPVSKRQAYRWAVCAVLAVFMMMTAGHAQVALYGLVLTFAYSLWRIHQAKTARLDTRASLQRLALVALVSGAVTMVSWVPQLSAFAQSVRAGSGANLPEGWFLPWQHLVQFIAPDFFGNPATLNYWGVWNYGEFVGYIGIAALVLALAVLFTTQEMLFWGSVVVVALLCMLPHPLAAVLSTLHIPLVGSLQPTRLMMLVDLALSIAAAFGLDALLYKKRIRLGQTIGIVGLVVAGLWIWVLITTRTTTDAAWLEHLVVARRNLILPTFYFACVSVVIVLARVLPKWKESILPIGIIAITVVELFRFGWKFMPFTQRDYFFPTTRVLEFLQKQPQPYRVLSLDDRILPPNASSFYGIETIEGYDPLVSKRVENFFMVASRNAPDVRLPSGFNRIYTMHTLESTLLPFMNVRFVLSLTDINLPFMKLVMTEGETRVYENMRSLPRVYIAQSIQTNHADDAGELTELFALAQKPSPALIDGEAAILSLPLQSDEVASISAYTNNEIHITSHTINPRFIVILNTFDARWRAYIDGKQVPLYRTNYLFSGIAVPKGEHRIQLRYSLL